MEMELIDAKTREIYWKFYHLFAENDPTTGEVVVKEALPAWSALCKFMEELHKLED